MVVFWNEDSGCQLRLIAPGNEGGDELSTISVEPQLEPVTTG